MKLQRILHSFAFVGAIFLALCMAGGAFAQEYPTRPITVICWSSPGAPNDLLARQIAKVGEKYFGQRMDVLTKKGGSGAVAMAYLMKQKRDGYTLSTTTVSQVVAIAAGHVPFKASDFTYIMRIQSDPYLIAVRSDSPFKNLKDFFDYAKKNPGKLSISGFGTASAHFLAFMRLKARAGNPDIRWVAYEGGADAAVACLGGHVNAVHTNYSVLGEYVKAGKMRVLGVSSEKRLSFLPEVPTYKEQGYNLAPDHWRGLMGPAGIPAGVVKKIRADMEKTVADPGFKKFMTNSGAEYGLMASQGEFQKWVEGEVSEYHELLEKLNLLGKKKKK
jgi:putative tricarboxylic transport membrane protein